MARNTCSNNGKTLMELVSHIKMITGRWIVLEWFNMTLKDLTWLEMTASKRSLLMQKLEHQMVIYRTIEMPVFGIFPHSTLSRSNSFVIQLMLKTVKNALLFHDTKHYQTLKLRGNFQVDVDNHLNLGLSWFNLTCLKHDFTQIYGIFFLNSISHITKNI